jgi:hypothetical protein
MKLSMRGGPSPVSAETGAPPYSGSQSGLDACSTRAAMSNVVCRL